MNKATVSNETADIWRRVASDLKVLEQRADALSQSAVSSPLGQQREGDRRLRSWVKIKAEDKVMALTGCD